MRAQWLRFNTANLLTRLVGALICSAASVAYAASPGPDPAGVKLVASDLLTMPVSNLGKLIQVEEVCEEDELMAAAGRSMPAIALNVQANAASSRAKPAAPSKPGAAAKPAEQAGAPPEPATQVPVQSIWEIALADKTLNTALSRWAVQAGWQLVWDLPVDYAVETRTTVPGTFVEAVTLITKSMATAEIPMRAIFYDGNKVLRIVAKGAE
jgi:hypothetical protein